MSYPDFLINLPYHKKWYLPDRRHMIEIQVYGNFISLRVFDPAEAFVTIHGMKLPLDGKRTEARTHRFVSISEAKYRGKDHLPNRHYHVNWDLWR